MVFFFQAEDGIRCLVRSRGLGDVYKRQAGVDVPAASLATLAGQVGLVFANPFNQITGARFTCLLYTSDAADERSRVDLGGRRIIKKRTDITQYHNCTHNVNISDRHAHVVT